MQKKPPGRDGRLDNDDAWLIASSLSPCMWGSCREVGQLSPRASMAPGGRSVTARVARNWVVVLSSGPVFNGATPGASGISGFRRTLTRLPGRARRVLATLEGHSAERASGGEMGGFHESGAPEPIRSPRTGISGPGGVGHRSIWVPAGGRIAFVLPSDLPEAAYSGSPRTLTIGNWGGERLPIRSLRCAPVRHSLPVDSPPLTAGNSTSPAIMAGWFKKEASPEGRAESTRGCSPDGRGRGAGLTPPLFSD
jgi:hypothetical protein